MVNKTFGDFLNKSNIKKYSRYSSLGAVTAEHFKRTIRDLLKRSVFEQGDGNWFHDLPIITKQCNHRTNSSTKLTPTEGSLIKNEGYVYQNLLEKRLEEKAKFIVHDFIRTADLRKTFSKGDTTNSSYRLNEITETNNDRVPSYRLDILPEPYNETLFKRQK